MLVAASNIDVSAGGLFWGFVFGLIIIVLAVLAVRNGAAPGWVQTLSYVIAVAVILLLGFDLTISD